MKIITVGRGNVSAGLGALRRRAGHGAVALSRDGGVAREAGVLVVAAPGPVISATAGDATGLAGRLAIDAANPLPPRKKAFPALAHAVNSSTGTPVAEGFTFNFAVLQDRTSVRRVRPGSLYVAGDGARVVSEPLITHGAYVLPRPAGRREKARAVEDRGWLPVSGMKDGLPVFRRFAVPAELGAGPHGRQGQK